MITNIDKLVELPKWKKTTHRMWLRVTTTAIWKDVYRERLQWRANLGQLLQSLGREKIEKNKDVYISNLKKCIYFSKEVGKTNANKRKKQQTGGT